MSLEDKKLKMKIMLYILSNKKLFPFTILRNIVILLLHTTYSWNIKWQKCAGMGLNGFTFKNLFKYKILGARRSYSQGNLLRISSLNRYQICRNFSSFMQPFHYHNKIGIFSKKINEN